ncbi:alpha/beta hydrolase [Marinimicrobium agarilyticum]|uniref:alpha/beta hydrolase n=1 Tax=Marinimicrobium agarilyticum TaxID=306546 RepID=UPI000429BC0D|nr:alpha/beta hydrolase [Marinimicrobium agarilyticum]
MTKHGSLSRWRSALGFWLLTFFFSVGAAAEVTVHEDIPWAEPGGTTLTVDIYTPKGAATKPAEEGFPVVVIYHGGGWLINDESIMDSTARYLAENGGFVVANMNYRLLPDNDNTTYMNEIIEDVFGGLLWVKDHIAQYGGDPSRVAVTGDSAGGHLSAMILTAGRRLSSDGLSNDPPGFTPTYLPDGKTAEAVAVEDGLAVQAAVLSYGAFDLHAAAKGGFETRNNFFWQLAGVEARGLFGEGVNVEDDPELYRAVSPIYLVPEADAYDLPPMFVHVGSEDTTTPPEAVEAFVGTLREKGHDVVYKVYEGKNHAFLDSGCNEHLGNCFDEDAPDTLDDMIEFLNRHLR